MDRVTQRLGREVEGPRRCFTFPWCSELFDHRARQCFFLESRTKKATQIFAQGTPEKL